MGKKNVCAHGIDKTLHIKVCYHQQGPIRPWENWEFIAILINIGLKWHLNSKYKKTKLNLN